jgi:hypothetical protein
LTALALVYEVMSMFISLCLPVSEVAVAASLLATPLGAARLSGVVQSYHICWPSTQSATTSINPSGRTRRFSSQP